MNQDFVDALRGLGIEDATARSLANSADDWVQTWELPDLLDRVRLSLSRRMTRSLGRCTPSLGRIRLADWTIVHAATSAFAELLAHELAHVAVHELFGSAAKPHGRQWRALMAAVELPARTAIPGLEPATRQRRVRRRRRRRRYRYLHRCPTCKLERPAGRPVRQWRCGACLDAGRDGELEIWRYRT